MGLFKKNSHEKIEEATQAETAEIENHNDDRFQEQDSRKTIETKVKLNEVITNKDDNFKP